MGIDNYKEFAIQLVDRYDRVSNVYYHRMTFKAGGMIFTDDVSIMTTNDIHGEILMTPDVTELTGVNELYIV